MTLARISNPFNPLRAREAEGTEVGEFNYHQKKERLKQKHVDTDHKVVEKHAFVKYCIKNHASVISS